MLVCADAGRGQLQGFTAKCKQDREARLLAGGDLIAWRLMVCCCALSLLVFMNVFAEAVRQL